MEFKGIRKTKIHPAASNAFLGNHSTFNQIAINCKNVFSEPGHKAPADPLPENVRRLVSSSLSAATLRAYAADLAHYACWGGSFPATDRIIAEYIAGQVAIAKPSTIARRLAALSKAHSALGSSNPVKSELVRATMRGIRRTVGVSVREAQPLLKEDLFTILDASSQGLKDIRDRALLLMGFAGGFRRSELVALNVEDIEDVRQGIVVTIRRSKTDQEGKGRKIGIPFGRGRWCPVNALHEWLSISKIENGAVFRTLNKHAQLLEKRLSGEAVSFVLKERVGQTGHDRSLFSGHSLRSGFCTSAVMAGVSTHSIRQTTGHATDAMVSRYIRLAGLFEGNAAGAIL
jgi:integrase